MRNGFELFMFLALLAAGPVFNALKKKFVDDPQAANTEPARPSATPTPTQAPRVVVTRAPVERVVAKPAPRIPPKPAKVASVKPSPATAPVTPAPVRKPAEPPRTVLGLGQSAARIAVRGRSRNRWDARSLRRAFVLGEILGTPAGRRF